MEIDLRPVYPKLGRGRLQSLVTDLQSSHETKAGRWLDLVIGPALSQGLGKVTCPRVVLSVSVLYTRDSFILITVQVED